MLIDRGGDWKKKCHYDSSDKLKPGKESYFLSKYIPFILDIPTNNIHRIGGGREEEKQNIIHVIKSKVIKPQWGPLTTWKFPFTACWYAPSETCHLVVDIGYWFLTAVEPIPGPTVSRGWPHSGRVLVIVHILAGYWLSMGRISHHMLAYSIFVIISV